MLYRLLRPALFTLDAERAHGLALAALKRLPAAGAVKPELPIAVAGIEFPNPVGLAPGFDKNGEVFAQAPRLGFGFAEVGTLTPKPQAGNPKPRLFRLPQDRAVINRMGFNNTGMGEETSRRILRLRQQFPALVVGINVGANKDSPDRSRDYLTGVAVASQVLKATYVAINISSPNTPGLRDLQHGPALRELLAGCNEMRKSTPLFLKVAPDLDPGMIDEIAKASIDCKVDALIVSNTTISRPPLKSAHASESGGLSGAPLKPLALQRLRDFRAATGGALPLVGVGGIASAEDAWARIRAGASLVQLYSAMVYEGPGIARRIVRGMEALMRRDGFASVAEAVGSE